MISNQTTFSNTFDLRVIRSSVNKIQNGVEAGLNGHLREKLQQLDDNFSRDDLEQVVSDLDKSNFRDFERSVRREERLSTLHSNSSKLSYIENIDVDANSETSETIERVMEQMTTRETSYYNSHFKFSNSSLHLFKVEEFGGVFSNLLDQDYTVDQYNEEFANQVRERDDIDDLYAEAAEGLGPTVGNLESSPKPRLVWFEDHDHVLIEFWSLAGEDVVFDGQGGFSIEYNVRTRSAARIHLDTGIIEIFDGKDTEKHRQTLIDRIEQLCNPQRAETDGGQQVVNVENILRQQIISENDIWEIINSVGMLTTLESFSGHTADAKLSSVRNRDVRSDASHDDLKEDRPLERANVKLFFDDLDGVCEFIDPSDVSNQLTFDSDATQKDMKDEISDQMGYDNIDHVTVTLNEDNNKFRIQKENCSPSARKMVFHLVTNNLDW